MAWTGRNEKTAPVGVYSMAWDNQHPDKPIAAIDVVGNLAQTQVALLAITLGSQALVQATEAPFPAFKEDDFIVQYIDSSIKPGDDFFKFATGTWMKQNPIPSSERRWAVSNLIQNDIYDKLQSLSNDAAADKNASKIGRAHV